MTRQEIIAVILKESMDESDADIIHSYIDSLRQGLVLACYGLEATSESARYAAKAAIEVILED